MMTTEARGAGETIIKVFPSTFFLDKKVEQKNQGYRKIAKNDSFYRK
jgi:hypothetical protein